MWASPSVRQNGNPPAFDEAEIVVRKFHLQGKFGHPDGQLQRCTQVLIAENDPRIHGSPRLLPIDEHVVTIHGHLGQIRVRSQTIYMVMVTSVAEDLSDMWWYTAQYGCVCQWHNSSQSISRLILSAEQIYSKDLLGMWMWCESSGHINHLCQYFDFVWKNWVTHIKKTL